MSTLEQIIKDALLLPSESRALLAQKLIESLEFDVDDTIQKLWIKQAGQRRDEIRSGSVKPISGEEALSQIRRKIIEVLKRDGMPSINYQD